ncbi:hypothetical protein [Mycolicibacter minnesotensis]
MRLTGLIAAVLLVAGCSAARIDEPAPSSPLPSTSGTAPTTTSPTTTSPTTTSAKPAAPPAAGAPIADVIAWVESGRPVDPAGYHLATHDGQTTDLNDEIAFTVPAGPRRATVCMTSADSPDSTLACLVDLVNPPSPPEEIYGEWKGGWVDFGGNTLRVGSAHGDPGRFVQGAGAELPAGSTLAYGDYRCRADGAGLICVNYAHRSAMLVSPNGVEPFGCLHPVPPSTDAGRVFSCAS